mmetsp:Transcript_20030/g.56787  ORF Transcript_20030/g.56787 Transcript_20030/m.56787 type:complete len:293 (-) Transcript_20030:54-932(-)
MMKRGMMMLIHLPSLSLYLLSFSKIITRTVGRAQVCLFACYCLKIGWLVDPQTGSFVCNQGYAKIPPFDPILTASLQVPRVPDETQGIELHLAFLGEVGLLILDVELVLTALALDPHRELRVLGVGGRHIGVSVVAAELAQLVEAFLPGRLVRVPDEAKVLKDLLAFGGHGRVLALQFEFHLVTLSLDPLREWEIHGPVVRHEAVPVLLAELLELLEALLPHLRLVGTEAELAVDCGAVLASGGGGRIRARHDEVALDHRALVVAVEQCVCVLKHGGSRRGIGNVDVQVGRH